MKWHMDESKSVVHTVMTMYVNNMSTINEGTLELFTVGIFSPFFTHFPFHFNSIVLENETKDEKNDCKMEPYPCFCTKGTEK